MVKETKVDFKAAMKGCYSLGGILASVKSEEASKIYRCETTDDECHNKYFIGNNGIDRHAHVPRPSGVF